MPATRRNPQHVVQDHNPNRLLRSHVVMSRRHDQAKVSYALGFYNKTKAEMAEDLRKAVENTRGQDPHTLAE